MSQDTFSKDLLDRIVLIQLDIPGVKFAVPRFWEPIGNRLWSGFFNHITNITPNNTRGQPLKERVYLCEMRLIVGPLNAGYKGEYEDNGNVTQSAVIDAFDAQQRLGHSSDTNQPPGLRYVVNAYILPVVDGIQPFDYTDAVQGPQLWYLGIPYQLQVTAQFNVGRHS